MKFLFRLAIVALLLLGAAWLYGRSLPREHLVSSTIVLVAPADSVWRVIRNFEATPAWWSDLKSARRVAGQRETWEQDMGSAGTIRIAVTSETPGRRLVTTILNDDQDDWGGTWTYDIVATGPGTEVTVTENGWVERPLYRVVMNLRGVHRTVEGYLRSLSAHFGEVANPRRG
ncbi:MAG: SRPBCC domain-containing protein [Gemmatimonadaceae bacterium]